MSNAEWWIRGATAFVIISWVIKTEYQIRNLRNALLFARQTIKDDAIQHSVSNLTGPELDILLSDRLGGGSDVPAKSPVPQSATKGKD